MKTTVDKNYEIDKFMDFEQLNRGFFKDELQYHSSWDWLIPVFQVIKNLGIEEGEHGFYLIDKIDEALYHLDQSWVFERVFDFIEWYNANK